MYNIYMSSCYINVSHLQRREGQTHSHNCPRSGCGTRRSSGYRGSLPRTCSPATKKTTKLSRLPLMKHELVTQRYVSNRIVCPTCCKIQILSDFSLWNWVFAWLFVMELSFRLIEFSYNFSYGAFVWLMV